MRNQSWWHHVTHAVTHWAATQWARGLKVVAVAATTISGLAGLAALALSVAGIAFPPLEAAAALLETVSLVSAGVGAIAETALAATGKASWSMAALDVVTLLPAGSALVRASTLTRRAAAMKQFEAVDDAARRQKLRAYADGFRPPSETGPKTVAAMQSTSGRVYLGRSGFRSKLHPDIRNALDEVLPSARQGFHGRCAEIDCVNQALRSGDDPTGSVISTARVRGMSSAQHGTPIDPCPSCAHVLDVLGGTYQP